MWGPGSGQEESQGGEGWTGAESGSRPGSWNVWQAAGAGDEGVGGRGGASGERLVVADHEHSSAPVPHSGGNCAHQC